MGSSLQVKVNRPVIKQFRMNTKETNIYFDLVTVPEYEAKRGNYTIRSCKYYVTLSSTQNLVEIRRVYFRFKVKYFEVETTFNKN